MTYSQIFYLKKQRKEKISLFWNIFCLFFNIIAGEVEERAEFPHFPHLRQL